MVETAKTTSDLILISDFRTSVPVQIGTVIYMKASNFWTTVVLSMALSFTQRTLARLRPRPRPFSFPSPSLPRAAASSISVVKCSSRSMSSKPTANIKVGAAQMTSTNDLLANFNTCARLVKEAAAEGVKLLCFPESFSFVGMQSGESLQIAEPLDGSTMQKYCSLARDSNIWISLGGFQEKGPDDAHLYNTHVLVDDSGNIRNTYRKIHLFDVDVPGNMVYKESSFTKAGNDIVAEDSPAGRLGLTVCYDLRFPELYQQLRFQHQAQVLLVPSAFTKVTGEAHWEILLRARAIETQCYVVAAAQAGMHNKKRESYGDSLIIDPWGKILARLPDRQTTGIAIADIDLSTVDAVRTRMPISEHKRLDGCQKFSPPSSL